MKKFLIVGLVLIFSLGFISCDNGTTSSVNGPNGTNNGGNNPFSLGVWINPTVDNSPANINITSLTIELPNTWTVVFSDAREPISGTWTRGSFEGANLFYLLFTYQGETTPRYRIIDVINLLSVGRDTWNQGIGSPLVLGVDTLRGNTRHSLRFERE